jgi:hypothetical protein
MINMIAFARSEAEIFAKRDHVIMFCTGRYAQLMHSNDKKPIEIDMAPPGTRRIRVPQRVVVTDKGRLLSALTTRPQRITHLLQRLRWPLHQLVAAIGAAGDQVELHTMHGCGCKRYRIDGEEYSHIAKKESGGA